MALGDPFAAAGQFTSQLNPNLALQDTIAKLGEEQRKKEEQRRQQEQSFNMLRQFGILKEEPATPADTVKAYEDVANKTIKNTYGELKTQGNVATDEQKIQLLDTLFNKFGIPKPNVPGKGMTLDYDKAVEAGLKYSPTTGEIVLEPKRKTGVDIASPEGLTEAQQLQAYQIATKVAGKRRIQEVVPIVYGLMRKGYSMDTIEDQLRYASQSSGFSGAIREAAQSVYSNANEKIAQNGMDYIDDLQQKGDVEGAKIQLKKAAFDQADPETKKSLRGKERTIDLINEIEGDLNTLKQNGVDTNIFRGTAEQIANKVGTVNNPNLRQMATKIRLAIQNYRRAMTGLVFTEAEAREYKDVFPEIKKDAGFNAANINALKDVFSGDIDFFYESSIGKNAYQQLFNDRKTESNTKSVTDIAGITGRQQKQYSQEDLEYTAKKRGISVDEVKKRLGVQ